MANFIVVTQTKANGIRLRTLVNVARILDVSEREHSGTEFTVGRRTFFAAESLEDVINTLNCFNDIAELGEEGE